MRISRRGLIAVLLISGLRATVAVGFDTTAVLGEALYRDENLSLNRNQSCDSCHQIAVPDRAGSELPPVSAFVDPRNHDAESPVSPGSVPGQVGLLNAPSAKYAAFSPAFHWDPTEGLYVGGQFWNGRAAGLAEQAALPPVNPREMALPSHWAVVSRLKENPEYVRAFRVLYSVDLDRVPARELAPAEVSAPAGVEPAYVAMTQAIAAFEREPAFAPFTSKFDFYLAGVVELRADEARGLELWNDAERSKCGECHPATPVQVPDGSERPALFTDFTYDNLGVPANAAIDGPPDLGLSGRAEIAATDPAGLQRGKQKVMSVRNIALTAPYMHNGVFTTLEQVVHFYNTRDGLGRVCRDSRDPGFGVDCWPPPEVAENVNTEELGDLKLSDEDERALVAFMRTLTDGYPDWGGDSRVPPGTAAPLVGARAGGPEVATE
ncbi:MAG: hypothetical protein KDG50_06060 [Chromatiales bacterium]|nr:hypothetical protein [Chromatiales bacterium]